MIARFIQVTVFVGLLSPFGAIAERPPIPELPEKIIDIREVIADADNEASCKLIRKLQAASNSRNLVPVAFADLMLRGRCLDRDIEAARVLLEKAVKNGLWKTNAQARLGWLYEVGIGVDPDIERARKLYKQAVGEMLPLYQHAKRIDSHSPYLSRIGGYSIMWSAAEDSDRPEYGISFGHPADEAERWDMTIGDAVFNFVDSATGPWELPQALVEERNQLVQLMERSENGVLTIANFYRFGTHGYPIDHEIAFEWIQHAAMQVKTVDAMRTFLNWFHDSSFCQNDGPACIRDNFLPNRILANLAAIGDGPALSSLRQCVENTDLHLDRISKDRHELVSKLHPQAMQDQDALEEARQDLLKKLARFEPKDKHDASTNEDVQYDQGRAAFGDGLAVFILLWDTPCPYLGS